MLRHQGQVKLPPTLFEQGLKCGSDSGLVCNAESIELLECGVVGFDRFVGGFEGEGGHFVIKKFGSCEKKVQGSLEKPSFFGKTRFLCTIA